MNAKEWIAQATRRFKDSLPVRGGMVSHDHHSWVEAMKRMHDEEKPFAPENGKPLKFNVGDHVTYTNEFGVSFQLEVTGIATPEECNYWMGERYFLNWSCHWMAVTEDRLTITGDKGA